MRSEEKITKEAVLIRYYNVLFYLFFRAGIDDFKRQCLVNRIDAGESVRLKQYRNGVIAIKFHLRPNLFIEKISHLKLICGTYIRIADLEFS